MDYKEVYPQELQQGYTMDGLCILMLYEPMGELQIPVTIGPHEAEMIMLEQDDSQPRRPLTHEMVSSLLEAFMLELEKVTIDRVEEGIFYASLHVSDGFSHKRIDARTSDAIIMALREKAPILASTSVLTEAGCQIEEEEPTSSSDAEMSLAELEELLHELEAKEDYEEAALIQKEIDRRKNKI